MQSKNGDTESREQTIGPHRGTREQDELGDLDWHIYTTDIHEEEVKSKSLSCVRLFATPLTIQSMEFSGQNTGVASLSLLLGIFPTQGWNPGLPHCRQIPYQLSHKGSPLIYIIDD